MKPHPLAEIFPMLDEAGLQELAWDVRTNGLMDPIVVLDDLILDGRNRFEACRRAEVEPRLLAFQGKDPVAFVASKNLYRRQLTTSQRAMVAARILDIQVPPSRGSGTPDGPRSSNEARATRRVAEVAAVGHASVERARTVIQKGTPELAKAVEDGKIRVSRAAELAMCSPEEQRAAIANPPKVLRPTVSSAGPARDEKVAVLVRLEDAMRAVRDATMAAQDARGAQDDALVAILEEHTAWMTRACRRGAA